MRNICLLLLLYINIFNVFGQNDEFEIYRNDYVYCESDSERVWDYYTYSIVKDSILMDKIIERLDEIFSSDSLINLIRKEYYPAWQIGKEKSFMIGIKPRDSIDINCINENFIPQGFNTDILNDMCLEISVLIDFYNNPYGKFYTEYKGKKYFFENKYLINPTEKMKRFLSEPISFYHLYDFLVIFFIYHNGNLYLDPIRTSWESIYE